ncbi:hypothetical protein CWI39_0334p0010 [Hamiltosporidium magnivora]|uniref:Uncharacterized protein n=1 Tax=Hamiltosporidium magnivora TaxID=148818 RepID=A0A4Q9LH92_9MICR|nr:hypothetical protein CWI39_0334p0010 [Hamiltosporidium magnivora]
MLRQKIWQHLVFINSWIFSANFDYVTDKRTGNSSSIAENHVANNTKIDIYTNHSIDNILSTHINVHLTDNNYHDSGCPRYTISNRFHPYFLPQSISETPISSHGYQRNVKTHFISPNTLACSSTDERDPNRMYSTYYNKNFNCQKQNFKVPNKHPQPIEDISFVHSISKNITGNMLYDIPSIQNESSMISSTATKDECFHSMPIPPLQDNMDSRKKMLDVNVCEGKISLVEPGKNISITSDFGCYKEQNNQGIILKGRTPDIIDDTNINQNISDMLRNGKTIEEIWSDLATKPREYIATSDNSKMSRTKVDFDKKKNIVNYFSNYFIEFSMTQFQKISKYLFIKLRAMQRDYENVFKFLVDAERFNSTEKEKYVRDNILSRIIEYTGQKKILPKEKIPEFIELIFSGINPIIQNKLLDKDASIPQIKLHSKHLKYSIYELENMFSAEIRNLETQDIDISNIINLCSFFVKYEKTLFGDMNISTIIEVLRILRLNETLSKLKECLNKNMIYEIYMFLELYEQNLVCYIRKHHVISTIFIIKTLYIHINRINYTDFFRALYKDVYSKQRFTLATQIFGAGRLFERLLRNLENQKIKADCYGMLSTFRLFFQVINFCDISHCLLKLQIPCLIAMIFDKSFLFNENQVNEFIAFLLYLMKITDNHNEDFYSDKTKYFLEINNLLIDNITESIILFINKNRKIRSSKYEIEIIGEKCIQFLNNSSKTPEEEINQKDRLQRLYISQLYWVIAFRSRATCFLLAHNNISRFFNTYYRKIVSESD